jgi:hypothetical protein
MKLIIVSTLTLLVSACASTLQPVSVANDPFDQQANEQQANQKPIIVETPKVQADPDLVKDPKCVVDCDIKFTKPYQQCKGVVECQDYVQREANNCINDCPEAP